MTQESVFTVVTNFQHSSVLLVKRKDVAIWTLPGGGLEKGEKKESGAKRELFEETNIQDPFLFHVTTYLPQNKLAYTTHLFITFFSQQELEKYPFLDHSNESIEISVFSIEELPQTLFSIHRKWIFEVLSLAKSQEKKLPLIRKMDEVNYRWFFQTVFSNPLVCLKYIFLFLLRKFRAKNVENENKLWNKR